MTADRDAEERPQDRAIDLHQQVDQLRKELRIAQSRAERPDPWDPSTWAQRARRIAATGRRAAKRISRQRSAPQVAAPPVSNAPSRLDAWLSRQDGARFVGFPVDWRFSREKPPHTSRIAVVLHCHFQDLLDDLLAQLTVISEPFDLYVTNSSGTPIAASRLDVAGAAHAEVLTVENHGRDILPLVQVVNAGILDPYDVILKVHTKKSAWRAAHADFEGDGQTWRESFESALLGGRDNVAQILEAFNSNPDLGVVTADGSIVGTEHWGGDLELVRGIYQRLAMPLDPGTLRFPAGSMYWIRGFILQGLRAFRFSEDDFETEAGQVDGTCAHAIERMIGLLATEAGFTMVERSQVESIEPMQRSPRVVSFYLPQFHRVAENDRWWGHGFTEWHNVVKAKPIFGTHIAPLRPTELGYYSLELDSVRRAQRDLAVGHGVAGFMYYYYWFAGQRLLSEPIERLLDSDIDQPFCIMWANENWTRRWDGQDTDVLIAQRYDDVPAESFIEDVLPLLRDPRYMRVDDRPVLAVYKLAQLPDPAATVAHWRTRCHEEGLAAPLIIQVDVGEAMGALVDGAQRSAIDGSLTFAPHNLSFTLSEVASAPKDPRFKGNMMSYRGMVEAAIEDVLPAQDDSHFPGVMVTFDNTARRQWTPDLFTGSNPYTFRRWLAACADSVQHRDADKRLVFVNAWNEWAEAAVLEPTEQFGRTYLLACRTIGAER